MLICSWKQFLTQSFNEILNICFLDICGSQISIIPVLIFLIYTNVQYLKKYVHKDIKIMKFGINKIYQIKPIRSRKSYF